MTRASSFLVDPDYLALAVLFGVFGIVGITATAGASPNIFALATCNCIPTASARLQELSVTLLIFCGILAPISIRRVSPKKVKPLGAVASSGSASASPHIRSGSLLALGASLVVLGIDLVAVPALMVLGNATLIEEGIVITAFGLLLAYEGGRTGQVMTTLIAFGALGIGLSIDSVVQIATSGATASLLERLAASLCLLAAVVASTLVAVRRAGLSLRKRADRKPNKGVSGLGLH